jgi:hypothetical protein
LARRASRYGPLPTTSLSGIALSVIAGRLGTTMATFAPTSPGASGNCGKSRFGRKSAVLPTNGRGLLLPDHASGAAVPLT